MIRRPSRDWLEALLSGALVTGCAGAAVAPPPASSPAAPTSGNVAPAAAPPVASAAEPAPAAQVTPPEPAAPAKVELPAFNPASCTGKVPALSKVACGDDPFQNLAQLRSACNVDAIVVYSVTMERAKQGVSVPTHVEEKARSADPCATAADKASCVQRLKDIAFPGDMGFWEGGSERTFLLVAQGESWSLVSNKQQLTALAGVVDSKQDAAAVLWLNGWSSEVACSSLQAQKGGFSAPSVKVGLLCPGMRRGFGRQVEEISHPPDAYEKEGNYRLVVDALGALKVTYLGGAPQPGGAGFGVSCGRRPTGMQWGSALAGAQLCDADSQSAAYEVGTYLAEGAQLEAAAVVAFELLASELAAHGAPASFVQRCLQAAEDERRHTALMTAAARRFGIEPALPAPLQRSLPSLLELARENTIEGCVRELWGALSAEFQARAAADPQLADMYRSIAPDELAHAQLSWDIHQWLAAQTGAWQHLGDVAAQARSQLLAEQQQPSAAVASFTGAPPRAMACQLIQELAA